MQASLTDASPLPADPYRLIAEHGREDRFEPAMFPGLVIDLAELWP